MTRDECLLAISAVFSNVRTEAIVGYWNVRVDTVPPRELVLTNPFVERNIIGNSMSPDDLTNFVRMIPESRWTVHEDGTKTLIL
jgi:hypothetical protein